MITFLKEERIFVMATALLVLSGVGLSKLNHSSELQTPIIPATTTDQSAPGITIENATPLPAQTAPVITTPNPSTQIVSPTKASVSSAPTPTPVRVPRHPQHSRENESGGDD